MCEDIFNAIPLETTLEVNTSVIRFLKILSIQEFVLFTSIVQLYKNKINILKNKIVTYV